MRKSIKSSWAVSRVRCQYETDVSRTISVIIIRDLIRQRSFRCLIYVYIYIPHLLWACGRGLHCHIRSLTMMTGMVLETSAS
jgi:hypothetical protein